MNTPFREDPSYEYLLVALAILAVAVGCLLAIGTWVIQKSSEAMFAGAAFFGVSLLCLNSAFNKRSERRRMHYFAHLWAEADTPEQRTVLCLHFLGKPDENATKDAEAAAKLAQSPTAPKRDSGVE